MKGLHHLLLLISIIGQIRVPLAHLLVLVESLLNVFLSLLIFQLVIIGALAILRA
jgi:hypothetical protein